ncbi:MAG: ribonuclease HII, partial [Hyphomicrobiales bacterium]|nr:ribonuclease HII [Hyphomicrobiales bacterium]
WSVAFAEVEEIDRINIYWAGLLAMRRAVEGLSVAPQHILIDARRLKELEAPQQALVNGDARSLTIAAASILAKTARDSLMRELDGQYPGYGFAKHKGYPVREHYAALQRLGACPVHRRSFAPVRTALGLPPLPPWPNPRSGAERVEELTQPELAPGL